MRKTWKKIVSVLMALTFVVLGLPVFDTPVKSAKAAALSPVEYKDENGDTQTVTDYTLLSDGYLKKWENGIYVVGQGYNNNPVTFGSGNKDRVSVSGNVVLIIPAGRSIKIPCGINVPAGNSFTIYGEGTLTISSPKNNNAGIGGNENEAAGSITIVGGKITVKGGKNAAGIGGGSSGNGGTITICGTCEVTATGGTDAAGIGGGARRAGGTINVKGGTVNATGGDNGAGIGSGRVGSSDSNSSVIGTQTITISDGSVTAKGGSKGSGIGSGQDAHTGNETPLNHCGTITITGGTVNATAGQGGNATGIGGYFGSSDKITISGGTVTATIQSGGHTAIGGAYNSKTGAVIEITGGTVTASAGNLGSNNRIISTGIGNGHNYGGSDGSVSLDFTDTSSVKAFNYKGTVTLESPAKIDGTETELEAGSVSNLSQIANLTLVKGTTPTYTITWKDDEGNVIDTTTVDKGVVPTHDDPTKKSTKQYDFEFAGWDPGVAAATGDATYTATFDPKTRSYTIKFNYKTEEGVDTYISNDYPYGATASEITPNVPTNPKNAQYTYTLTGWDKEIKNVDDAAEYTAVYTCVTNEYTIKFNYKTENGTDTSISTAYPYGTTASEITPNVPTNPQNAKYTYTLTGWDKAIADVQDDAEYTAVYTDKTNEYTIKFNYKTENGTDTYISTAYPYGTTASEITPNVPTNPKDAQYTYTLTGWDKTITDVEGNAEYTAVYSSELNQYTVTWIVDGTTTTTNVEYGYPAVYGSTPTKADEGDVTFEFAGWQVTGGDTVYGATQTLPNVTGPDVSYTALFTAYYPITFGEIIEGSMSVEGGDPSDPRAAEGNYVTLNLSPTEGYQYHDGSIKVMCGNTGVDVYQIGDNQFEFTMPAGSVEVTAVCECFYNVWVNGKQISSLTASNVLQDYDAECNEAPRMTYSETSEKMVLTILTSDEIKLNNPDPDGSKVMIEIQDTDLGRPFEVVAPTDGFNLVSDTAAYGIYSLSSDIIITGDGELTGSSGEFYGIGSWFDFSITINGKMTINSSPDSEEGFGLFTSGDITINDDITIVGGGAQAIYSLGGGDITITAANVNVSGGYSYGIGTFGDGTVLIQGKDGGKATVAISTKGNAISSGAGITITGDVSVTSEYLDFENAIVTDGDCTIDGNLTLDIGGNGNGIYAEGDITISGDVIASDSYDGEDGGVLLYGTEKITVGGSFKASNPSGDLISTMKDISITGDIAGLEDDQPAVAKRGITAFEGTVTVNGNVLMETLAELESAIVAKNLTVGGDFDLTCVGSGIFTTGDVVLGGNVTIVNSSEESAIGINALGTITMVEGIWDIQLKKGDALSAGTGITIPDTHGVSVPENGEIGYYENEDMGCYTVVVDGNGGCNTVRIEPFIPVAFVNDDGTKLQTVKGYPGQSPKYTGEKPTKASTAEKVYTFKGWKDAAGEYGKDEDLPDIADGSDALTYTAVFEEATEVYTITFVNEDGTELQSGKVAYGETPKYDGATPTKASDDKYDYTFDGWTPEIVKVTGEATYKAAYKATEIKKDPVKGVYKHVSEGAPKYTKGSNKSVVITFKRTENDEITFDMFKGVKTAKGELISGKHYTAKKGSVEITILPEYLETLEVGKTAVTVSFEDGDPVTIELEVAAAAQQQTDTQNPATGDQMNYIWIFFVIGAAALAIVLFVQVQRRRREEEI